LTPPSPPLDQTSSMDEQNNALTKALRLTLEQKALFN